jgi:hypothetical protein
MRPITQDLYAPSIPPTSISKGTFNVERYQADLVAMATTLMPLEIGYPIILQFLGDPWDRDTYVFEKPLFMGAVRNDIIRLSWTKCCLDTALKELHSRESYYNGELFLAFHECLGIRVTLFQGSEIQTPEEALRKLRITGLHVRPLDGGGLIGGSHVDASSGMRMIEHSFLIQPANEFYDLNLEGTLETGLTLHAAVDRVITTVMPRPNIEAPPRVCTPGQAQEYSTQQDPLKCLTPEELENVPHLTKEEIQEALEQGRKDAEAVRDAMPMIRDSGRRYL